MIDGKTFFDQPTRNNKIPYGNIRKIATDQGDDFTTGCLLDYPYFKGNYKMIAIVNVSKANNLSKQQALDADPRAIQQINFTANLNHAGSTRIFFILKQKKLFLTFHKEL